jgi:putative lipoprotein
LRLLPGVLIWLCAICPLRAHAADPDPWLGPDKALHFGVEAVFARGSYSAASFLWKERWKRAAIGGGVAFSAGIAKELYDLTGRGDPSWKDLTWDAIGTGVGIGLSVLLDIALEKIESRPSAHDPPKSTLALAVW